jgi:hypothetical protein
MDLGSIEGMDVGSIEAAQEGCDGGRDINDSKYSCPTETGTLNSWATLHLPKKVRGVWVIIRNKHWDKMRHRLVYSLWCILQEQ